MTPSLGCIGRLNCIVVNAECDLFDAEEELCLILDKTSDFQISREKKIIFLELLSINPSCSFLFLINVKIFE